MIFIGITGGVGAGKSRILEYLKENDRFLVREADKIARDFYTPDSPVFKALIDVLGKEVLSGDGYIDKQRMAGIIFNDDEKKAAVNELIHPAVKEWVLSDKEKADRSGRYDIYFLEAALLIECGYDKICDELWYIYADPSVRKERLLKYRGYSPEKTDSIIKSQLPDKEYRKHCAHIIDNSGELSKSLLEIDRIISGYSC